MTNAMLPVNGYTDGLSATNFIDHLTGGQLDGPSGNPDDVIAANIDESKARLYNAVPDPLIFDNVDSVRTREDWYYLRRAEITEHFDKEIYGRVPDHLK